MSMYSRLEKNVQEQVLQSDKGYQLFVLKNKEVWAKWVEKKDMSVKYLELGERDNKIYSKKTHEWLEDWSSKKYDLLRTGGEELWHDVYKLWFRIRDSMIAASSTNDNE